MATLSNEYDINFVLLNAVILAVVAFATFIFLRKTNGKLDKKALVLRFDQVGKEAVSLVGGKGANLGELTRAGFKVPNGFCVTSTTYRKQLESMKSSDEGKENDIAKSHSRMLQAEIPVEIQEAIASAYRKLSAENGCGAEGALVAVRSSATSEDSAETSFAGQLETYLGVQGEESVITAVRECWASVHSARVASYRSDSGDSSSTADGRGSEFACCVVVQLMLDADSAGVAFTANPLTKDEDQVVITGNWGLGESVVADLVTPDTWIVQANSHSRSASAAQTEVVDAQISAKQQMVVLAKKDGAERTGGHVEPTSGCSVCVPVDDARRQAPCLSEDQVKRLAALARQVEAYYGGVPQDLEWGLQGEELYLLQTRPITTLGHSQASGAPSVGEFDTQCRTSDWVTTCNAQEMFPGVGTPLTMSTFGEAANYAVQYVGMRIGSRKFADTKNRVLEWHAGHLFLNMTNTLGPMCASMIGSTMTKENGEMSILGRVNDQCTPDQLVTQSGFRTMWLPMRAINGLRYLYTMGTAHWLIPVMLERQDRVRRLLRQPVVEQHRCRALWNRIDGSLFEMRDQWADGIVTSSTSAAFMLFVMKVACKSREEQWSPAAVGDVAILLGNAGEGEGKEVAESADAIEALEFLRDELLKDLASAKQFCALSDHQALAVLAPGHPVLTAETTEVEETHGKFSKARELFKLILERHGHRCVKEAEMRTLEWGADPSPLVRLLKNLLSQSINAKKSPPAEETRQKRMTAEELIQSKSHLNVATRWLLRKLVALTRAGVHRREYGKSLQVKTQTEFKKAYRLLGSYLEEEGTLPESDLIYFLTHQEIGEVTDPTTSEDRLEGLVSRAIKRRRLVPLQEKLSFRDLYQGTPVPLSDQVAKEGVAAEGGAEMVGTPVSAGFTMGVARIVKTLEEADQLQEGEILICPFTDVGWTPYFSLASGLVTEIGGMLSHGAVVAREYGLPCVVNLPGACSQIKNGQRVSLDGSTGVLRVMEDSNEE